MARRYDGFGHTALPGVEVDKIGEIPIYFDKDGAKFRARLGPSVITRKDLSDLKREIGKRTQTSVDVMMVTGSGIDRVTVVSKEAHGRFRLSNGHLTESYVCLYIIDEQAAEDYTALIIEQRAATEAFRKRQSEIMARLQPLRDMPEPPRTPKPGRVGSKPRDGG